MSGIVILSLTLVAQSKAKAVPADAFGPRFTAGAKAYLYVEAAGPQAGKPFPVPVAASLESYQKGAHLYSVIFESKNTKNPLANPPTAQDSEKAQQDIASLEKRRQIFRVDSRTAVQVLGSDLIVSDTLRNREAETGLDAIKDNAAREKKRAEISMRLCRVKITEGPLKGKEAWAWAQHLVASLPKGAGKSTAGTSTRQKELQAIVDKRRALAAKKRAIAAARTESERAAAQKAYNDAMRNMPSQAEVDNAMRQQQAMAQEAAIMQQQAAAAAQAQMGGVQVGIPVGPYGGGGGYP
jgi:hypothetical protein